jgi:yeast amino acid transporter
MATKPVFAEDSKRRPSATDIAGIPRDSDSGEDAAKFEAPTDTYQKLPFWTRMGVTPDSFRRRTAADEHNQLNQTLKGRHLHMIAIGRSQSLAMHSSC